MDNNAQNFFVAYANTCLIKMPGDVPEQKNQLARQFYPSVKNNSANWWLGEDMPERSVYDEHSQKFASTAPLAVNKLVNLAELRHGTSTEPSAYYPDGGRFASSMAIGAVYFERYSDKGAQIFRFDLMQLKGHEPKFKLLPSVANTHAQMKMGYFWSQTFRLDDLRDVNGREPFGDIEPKTTVRIDFNLDGRFYPVSGLLRVDGAANNGQTGFILVGYDPITYWLLPQPKEEPHRVKDFVNAAFTPEAAKEFHDGALPALSTGNVEAAVWPWQHAKVGTAPAELDLTLQHAEGCDTVLFLGPRKMLSWGPRHEQFNHDVAYPKPGEETHFWSVFIHGVDNELQVVADLDSEGESITLVRELIPSWIFQQYLGEGQTADLDPFPFGESIAQARQIAKCADKLMSDYWQGKVNAIVKKHAGDNLPS